MKRYVLDTNILLRFLLKDIPAQSKIVRELFTQAKRGDMGIEIPLLVFVELDFALTKYYAFSKPSVSRQLQVIAQVPYAEIEERSKLFLALAIYEKHSVSFVDSIFVSLAVSKEKGLMTFDKKLQKLAKNLKKAYNRES